MRTGLQEAGLLATTSHGRPEQSEFARPFDRFRPLVRPELLVDVAHVCLHRARGEEDFARDLGRRQVAGQIAEHAHLAFREFLRERDRLPASCPHRGSRQDVEDAR